MKNIRPVKTVFLLIVFLTCSGPVLAQNNGPTLNYQGRVNAGGSAYSGPGWFSFRIFNQDGESVWANTETAGTNRPSGSISNYVNNGLFNIQLGDWSMDPISPTVFHEWNLQLRTWFSTNGSVFELLEPDTTLRPLTIADIDTAGTIIVDNEGKADFDNVQDAIDLLVADNAEPTNRSYSSTIVIMPGYYSIDGPLDFPTNSQNITLMGVGSKENDVYLDCTNGVMIVPNGEINLVNLSLSSVGDVVIDDSTSVSNYDLEISNCRINRDGGTGPVIKLTRPGQDYHSNEVKMWRTEVYGSNDSESYPLQLSGDVQFTAEHCDFDSWGSSPNCVVISNYSDNADFEHCSLFVDSGTAGSAALKMTDCPEGGWLKVISCDIEGTVRLLNCLTNSSARIYDSSIHSSSNAGIYITDARYIQVEDSSVNAWEDSAVIVQQTPAMTVSMYLTFSGSRIDHSCQETTKDGFVFQGTSTNDSDAFSVNIGFNNCDVSSWKRDAVSLANGNEDMEVEVDFSGCEVSATRYGISNINCEVSVAGGSEIDGDSGGIVSHAGEIGVAHSTVESDPGFGVYIYGMGFLDVSHSTISGYGGAVNCIESVIIGAHTEFESDGATALAITNSTPIALLANCGFMSFNTNSLPVIGLGKTTTNDPPSPEFINCFVRGMSTSASIDVGAGVSTAQVSIVNTILSSDLGVSIGVIAPSNNLGNGNYVVPMPESWMMMLGGD